MRSGGERVKFDGCAVWSPRQELLEAKGPGQAALVARADKSTFGDVVRRKFASQASRQAAIAGGRPIDWHVAEPLAAAVFRDKAIAGNQPITVMVDPPR